MGMQYGSRTDIGRVREHNEDSLLATPPLFAIADGMGGHAAGEVASEIAVQILANQAPRHADAEALGAAVEAANREIIQAAARGTGRKGMGCTMTAAIVDGERLVIAQVGDSRAYLLHDGNLQQLTRDHSLMADLIDAGEITPEEAKYHPQRSVITRALGSNPYMHADLYELNVEAGDRLMLCSDGLSGMVDDADLRDILATIPDPQECADELVFEANEAGGADNITAIVVDIEGFAHVRAHKAQRKSKLKAIIIGMLLAVIIGGTAAVFTWWTNTSAYLAEEEGKVAIYRGVPGTILGMTFSHLEEVTDVELSDLNPGVANRIAGEGLAVDNMDEAKALVEEYRKEIAEKNALTGTVAPTAYRIAGNASLAVPSDRTGA